MTSNNLSCAVLHRTKFSNHAYFEYLSRYKNFALAKKYFAENKQKIPLAKKYFVLARK